MKPKVDLRIALAMLTCAMALAPPLDAADQVAIEPQPGVLVLTNGQTLEGKITRAGDRYYVALKSGAINLPATDVSLHCQTLKEAYEFQRAAHPGRIENHLKLALWCLQNKLKDEARRELAAAAAINPEDPKIGILRRRLEQAAPPSESNAAASSGPPVLKSDELDRLVRGMPAGTMESYTSDVQPLLLNHCAAAACHGAQAKNEFRLLRTSPGAAPTRRMTQRNLHHVMQFVDRVHPQQSPLLTAVDQPHGPARSMVLGSRGAAQHQLLADWIKLVTQQTAEPPLRQPDKFVRASATTAPQEDKPTGDTPPASSASEEELRSRWGSLEGDDEYRVTEDGTIVMSADAGEPVDDQAQRPPASKKPPIRGAAGMAGRKPKVQWGAVPKVTPRDPFDPELFNRQFHPPR